MSGLQIRLVRDDITPDLRRKISKVSNPRAVLEAVGTQLVSITKRSFRQPDLRQRPWPAKKSGAPSNLIKKGMLTSSIRITAVTGKHVTVGTDRKYGAVHQLGSRKASGRGGGIPARPFFPFTKDGKLTPLAERKVLSIIKSAVGAQLK